MKDLLKILKIGVAKGDYPYYCQYINFDDKIQTCSGNIYVDVEENKFDIKGCINLFVLENVLKNCSTPQITQEEDKLIIEDGKFKTSIIIDDIDFPMCVEHDVDFIKLDSNLLYLLKTASKYTGEGLLSYIYMDKDYILATYNKEKVFYCKHQYQDLGIKGKIGINKRILSTLSEGVEVGTSEHNTVVKFDGGKIIFGISLLDNFPSDRIINVVENKPDVKKLCNIASIQHAVKMVSSVLFGEREKYIELSNKNKVLTVKAESAINGTAIYDIESELDEEYTNVFDVTFLQGIDLDYDVYVADNDIILYLTNGQSEILLVGAI